LKRELFKGISGTLKQKIWFSGLRETNWKPFESFSFFLENGSWGAFRGDGGPGTVDGSCRVTVGIKPR